MPIASPPPQPPYQQQTQAGGGGGENNGAKILHLPSSKNTLETGHGGGHSRDMTAERLAKLEGQVDTLKVVRPMTLTVFGLGFAAVTFVLGYLATQVASTNSKLDAAVTRFDAKFDSVNAKFDALNQTLATEFRAQHADIAAQITAITSAITATKQQPPTMVLVPRPDVPDKF